MKVERPGVGDPLELRYVDPRTGTPLVALQSRNKKLVR